MRQQIRIDSLSLFWFCILSLLLNECLSSQQTPPDSHQIENWFQIAQSELNRLGTQKLLLRNQNQNINTNNNLILNSNNNNGVNNVNNNNNNNQINSVVFEQTPPFQPLPSSSFFTPEQKLFLEQQLLNSNQLSNELSSAGVIRSKQNNDQANDFANLLLTVSKNLSPPIENNVNQIPPHGKQGGQDQGLLQHEQLSAPSPEKLIQSWDSYWMKGGQGSLGQFGTPTWDGKFPGGSPLNWKGAKIPPDQTKQQPDISRKGVPFSGTTRIDDMGPMPPAKDNQGLIRQASLLGCGCDPDDKTPGSDSSPVPRYGHVTTLRISEDCFNLVVHGGMDEEEALLYDIWEYNFQTKTWCEHIPKGKSNPSNPQATRFNPGPRMNHTGYMIDHNLIVIAGHNGLKTLKDIWEYDLVRDEWIRRLVLNGGDPPDRENAMGWTFAGNAYVYGGISTYVSGALGDLWRWNNEICEWKKIEAIDGNAPEPRYGATYGMYELVYMFGGKTNKQYYNDLWTWDPITNNWAELVPFVTDVVPVGRYLAAGALKSEYFVYGGISYQGVSLNDLWGFDVVLRTWRQVKSKGTNPPDLHLHSSFLYLQGFCIHGGKGEGGINPNIYCFDPATSEWTTVYSE